MVVRIGVVAPDMYGWSFCSLSGFQHLKRLLWSRNNKTVLEHRFMAGCVVSLTSSTVALYWVLDNKFCWELGLAGILLVLLCYWTIPNCVLDDSDKESDTS